MIQSQLKRLEDKRIFDVSLSKDKTILEFTERCDGYFFQQLTKAELQVLIFELQEIEKEMIK